MQGMPVIESLEDTDNMSEEEITVTGWKTKALKVYAWAKEHPGFMIPATAYAAGVATIPFVKLLWKIL